MRFILHVMRRKFDKLFQTRRQKKSKMSFTSTVNSITTRDPFHVYFWLQFLHDVFLIKSAWCASAWAKTRHFRGRVSGR
jgi:hypothetical protein